jgi:3-oxoacyl-[acyl-carrier protein] reductase
MQISFDGVTVIVTGAARGIGRAIAAGFVERGATVWACDIAEDGLATLAGEATGAGRLNCRKLDLNDEAAVGALVREAGGPDGTVGVLVHVAGGVRGQTAQPIETVSDQAWREIYDANVMGALHATRAVVPGMKRAGAGRIVVIASRAGMGVSLTGIQSYASAKAAQLGLVRQLAHELGPHGITVNAVAPGFMPTSPDYERQWASYGPEGQKALVERTPMRRLGRPEEIAYAVMFLASGYAGFINGQVLPVTGGPQA